MNRHPIAWIITPPAVLIVAAYVTTGRIWIGLGVAAAIGLLALTAALSDQVQRTKKAEEDARLFADDLDAAYIRIAELLRDVDDHVLDPGESQGLADLYDEPRPDLRVIPPQRTGDHDDLPVADLDVPVHTDIVDDDWLELLITRPADGGGL